MAIAQEITYDDKLGLTPKKTRINQVWDTDMNDLKTVINANKNILNRINGVDANGAVDGEIIIGHGVTGNGADTTTIGGATNTDTFLKGGTTVKGTVPGQDLLNVLDDAGNIALKIDGNSLTTIKGGDVSSGTPVLTVEHRFNYQSPFNQSIQVWKAGGDDVLALRADGSFNFSSPFSNTNCGKFNATLISAGLNSPHYKSNKGGGGTGILFPGTNNISLVTSTNEAVRIDQDGRVIIGGSVDTGNAPSTPIEASAHFQVASTTRGSIPNPPMLEAQRLAIATPAVGLHAYQTDGIEGAYVNHSTKGWSYNGPISFSDREIPTGVKDGVNTVFTLAEVPSIGSEHVYLNGLLQTLTSDYTIAGGVVTFVSAPISTDELVISSRY